ncbi:MAG: hypothetical protein KJO48_02650 [Ignavibacteria bacterium]|nr:hypothetical protein [Ignavibacteria bacterium]
MEITPSLKNAKSTSVDKPIFVSLSILKIIELSSADNDSKKVYSRLVNVTWF